MTILKVVAFGFGYLSGGALGACAAGLISVGLRDNPAAGPSPEAAVALMTSILVTGVAAGCPCVRVVDRLRRPDPVHADYDDRPEAPRDSGPV